MSGAWEIVEAVVARAQGLLSAFGVEAAPEAVLALSAGAAVFLLAAILVLLTRAAAPRRPRRAAGPRARARRRAGAPLIVHVARLVGDADGKATERLAHALSSVLKPAGGVVRRRGVAPAKKLAGLKPDRLGQAETKVRDAIAARGVDALVWGALEEGGADEPAIFLRVVAVDDPADPASRAAAETFALPAALEPPFDQAAAAWIVAGARPEEARVDAWGETLLQPLADALKPLAENPPADLVGVARCRVRQAYALLALRLHEETGDADWLRAAVEAARDAVFDGRKPTAPMEWGAAQALKGIALARRAAPDREASLLREAAASLAGALSAPQAARDPLARARLERDLGEALLALSHHDPDLTPLTEAAPRLAAAVATFDALGARAEADAARLGLARVLATLGEREAGPDRLVEAVTAFDAAVDALDRQAAPSAWAAAQHDRARALLHLGQRQRGLDRLRQSIAAYRSALEERTRERAPLDWAASQTGLGRALVALGERERGRGSLSDGVAALRAGLRGLEDAAASDAAARARRDLARAERLLAERKSSDAA